MQLDHVNAHLQEEDPSRMLLQSFDAVGGVLQLAFVCDGGPREDEAFLVQFKNVAIMHLPAVLHESVRFSLAPLRDVGSLVPACSFDEEELSGAKGAYQVVLLTNAAGKPHGYYLAAESVTASWVPMKDCRGVW